MAGVRIEPFNVQLAGGPSLLSRYASGQICPINQEITLYEDDFSTYGINSDVPNPPWTPFNQAPNGGVTVTTFVSALGLSQQAVAESVTYTTVRYRMWNATPLYLPDFNTTQCGVFTQCRITEILLAGGGSGQQIAGLCIGVADTTTTSKLIWSFRTIAATAAGLWVASNLSVGGTPLSNGAAFSPVLGDLCRLQLYRFGNFGWRLEAFINGVSVGSSTAASIQLTNADPKSIGMIFMGNQVAFLNGTSRWTLGEWEGGVC